jgi:hypothetical protein
MTNPKTIIVDGLTGEQIERPMTNDEFAQWQADQESETIRLQIKQDQEAAKEAAKAKLEALGLTMDDLKALGL